MLNRINGFHPLKIGFFIFMLFANNIIFAQTYNVNSISALESTVATASPGDIIELADGTYNTPAVLSGNGTETNPIIVKAATVNGVNMTQLMTLNNNWVTLSGFKFTGTDGRVLIGVNTTGCRVTRCSFINSLANVWINSGSSATSGARKIEIDHCLFDNKTNNINGSGDRVVLKLWVKHINESHHIHHNHFKDIPTGNASNGFEIIQLIYYFLNNPQQAVPEGSTNIIVENNLFDNAAGESEIISIKNNGTTIRKNTFLNCKYNAVVLRGGKGNTVEDNIFINLQGGIAVNSTDHVIKNNYFEKMSKFGIGFYAGTDGYIQPENITVHDNYFKDNRYAIQTNIRGLPTTDKDAILNSSFMNNKSIVGTGVQAIYYHKTYPKNTIYSGNVADGKLGIPIQDGITTNNIIQVTPVLLTKDDVGPYAYESNTRSLSGPFIMSPSDLK